MVLSPQMRQYLRLLQLPSAELENAVEAELSENPVLEEKIDENQAAEKNESLSENGEAQASPPKNAEELRMGENFERMIDLQEENKEQYQDRTYRNSTDAQKARDFQETLITKAESLSDFLLWQSRFLELEPEAVSIAEEIIGNLNDSGFLTISTAEIASVLKKDPEEIEKVLGCLQQLDPPGVCARNLQEALSLQLQRKNPRPELALKMIQQYFSSVAKRDWPYLAKQLEATPDEVKQAAVVISQLEPRPGRFFYGQENIAVIPDVSVYFDDDNEEALKIEVHQEHIPELRISPYYRRMLRASGTRPEVKNFIREKIQTAMNFINAVQLRKSTLRDITETIIKMQPEFFLKGFSHLKPMRLKDVSDVLGIHESTVSRALNGKYIATPQGTIAFKSFFSSKLESEDGHDESQKSMMQRIKGMIEKEDPRKPLSDQVIADQLQKEGIKIARRTVTKYRELMKIFPTHLRRQN